MQFDPVCLEEPLGLGPKAIGFSAYLGSIYRHWSGLKKDYVFLALLVKKLDGVGRDLFFVFFIQEYRR